MNSSARLVFSSSRRDHITPLLRELHWLKAPERTEYKLALLVYKCLQGVAPSYLADDLCRTADLDARHRLWSASSPSLVVRRTRLSTYGDRAFPVAASRVWNSLPHHVTSAQSLPVFCTRLKTYLFSRSFPWQYYCLCLRSDTVILDTLIVFTYLLTYSMKGYDICSRMVSYTAVLQCRIFPCKMPGLWHLHAPLNVIVQHNFLKNHDVPSSTHMFVKELFVAVIFRWDEHQKSQPPVIASRDIWTTILMLITI